MKKRIPILAAVAATVAAGLVWAVLGGGSPFQVASAEAADQAQATAREGNVDGHQVGEVWLNDRLVLRIRSGSAEFSPYDRAQKVADRLNETLGTGLKPEDVHAATNGPDIVVAAGNTLVATITAEEARLNASAPGDLAKQWASNIAHALGGSPGKPDLPEGATRPLNEPLAWTPPEEYKDKIVPILSLGNGQHIGAARVSGPSSKVDLVQAVAQGETSWQRIAEINVYIPISTKVPGTRLTRVQSCAVTAIGDLRF